MKNILKKILFASKWLLLNFNNSYSLKKSCKIENVGEYYLECLKLDSDLDYVFSKYENHFNLKFPLNNKILFKLFGSRLIIMAKDIKTRQPIGFDMFYFNELDSTYNTVHEGFVYVDHDWQNKRISKNLRLFACNFFKDNKKSGISTRIKSDNVSSLHSALKVGFKIQSKADLNNKIEEYYLVKSLK